jgi:membrane protein implicated in regulation of membrane protease activity
MLIMIDQSPSATTPTAPWYRREPWLAMSALSLVPIAIGLVAPPSWRVPLAGVTSVIVVLSLILLMMRQRALNAEETRERQSQASR